MSPTATHDQQFLLDPDPAGWQGWTAPLAALLRSLALGPVHVLSVRTPDRLQLSITLDEGRATVDVGGGLTGAGQRRLRSVGFTPTGSRWTITEPVADGRQLAELVAHVVVAIGGADARDPLVVDVIGDRSGCATCALAA